MANEIEQAVLDYYTYPGIGAEDWRYTFAAAKIRSLETQMLSRAMLLDMVGAEDFEQAADLLGASEYALAAGSKTIAEMENILKLRRSEVRRLFAELMIEEEIVELFRSRDDFANMRLALRRKLCEKPIGTDYSDDGNVPAELFEEIFEQENYSPLPMYMQEAIEQAVLAYYQNKDVRQIDYAIDCYQARFNISRAVELKNVFLTGLFRMQIDLTNIRTMMRVKFTESELRNVFLEDGFIEIERLKHGLDIGYEGLAPLFFATPYYDAVESGAAYLSSEKSFLRLEHNCESHLRGFLRTTMQITAGAQPVIAYLLLKESEIRTVRLILTAKKNSLDNRLILDRLGE